MISQLTFPYQGRSNSQVYFLFARKSHLHQILGLCWHLGLVEKKEKAKQGKIWHKRMKSKLIFNWDTRLGSVFSLLVGLENGKN